jgi:hypothetical protein
MSVAASNAANARQAQVVTRGEEENLLTTHAVAEGVDPARVECQPWKGCPGERRHSGEVVDLPCVSPRVERQPPPLSVRRDHREGAARRKAAPEAEVVRAVHAPVRRDHEWNRRMGALVVPAREHEIRLPLVPRVRPVREHEALHPAIRVKVGIRTECARDAREQHDQPRGEQDATAPARTGETIWLETG